MSDSINEGNQALEKKKTFFKTTKSKVILGIAIIIFAFITIGGIALGKQFNKFKDGPEGFIMERIAENLNLTDEQKAQVERIKDQIKERMEAKKSVRESMFEEFANEFRKDNLDKTKLRELSEKKDQQAQEMKEFVIDKIIEFHSLLTPEQRSKAMDNIKTMKSKFHDRMKKSQDSH